MKTMSCQTDRQATQAWVERWRRADSELEVHRLTALRALSEREAAQRFATLLRLEGGYPLRSSSGLIEQQRIFDRLRKQS